MNKEDIKCNYLPTATIFGCSGTEGTELKEGACFGRFIKRVEGNRELDETYEIYFRSMNAISSPDSVNPACFLSKEEITTWLESLARIYPFEFSFIEEIPDNRYVYDYHCDMGMKLHIKGRSIYHKFLLTCFRMIYEAPYSFILAEAFRMKNTIKKFENLSLINCVILASSTLYRTFKPSAEDGLTWFANFYVPLKNSTYRKLLDEMAEAGHCTLNLLFVPIDYEGKIVKPTACNPEIAPYYPQPNVKSGEVCQIRGPLSTSKMKFKRAVFLNIDGKHFGPIEYTSAMQIINHAHDVSIDSDPHYSYRNGEIVIIQDFTYGYFLEHVKELDTFYIDNLNKIYSFIRTK